MGALRDAAVLLLLLTTSACPLKDEAPSAEEARRLALLKAEVDRLGPRGAADEGSKLKALVEGGAEEKQGLGERPLPAGNPTVHVGTIALKAKGVRVDHTVRSGKVSLTSESVFVEVTLMAQNVGQAPSSLELAFAYLVEEGGTRYALATDAQSLAGTRPLKTFFDKGETRPLQLYFEAPLAAVDKGLTLVFPPGVGGETDVRISLH
jgi:hypothetical protein